MATFIYNGPTHDLGKVQGPKKVTLKVPKSDGTFELFRQVEPGVTELTITDAKALAFVRARKDLSGNSLYTEL